MKSIKIIILILLTLSFVGCAGHGQRHSLKRQYHNTTNKVEKRQYDGDRGKWTEEGRKRWKQPERNNKGKKSNKGNIL